MIVAPIPDLPAPLVPDASLWLSFLVQSWGSKTVPNMGTTSFDISTGRCQGLGPAGR